MKRKFLIPAFAAAVIVGSVIGYFVDHRPSPPVVYEQRVDTVMTEDLTLFYPKYGRIDFVTSSMPPSMTDTNIIMAFAGAYFGDYLDTFAHSNTAGDHVSGGVRYCGYRCKNNTGAFVYYNGRFRFLYKNYTADLDSAAKYGGCGFGQELLIKDGQRLPTVRNDDNNHKFRALCLMNDSSLCVVQSVSSVELGHFKDMLLSAGAIDALYLDMGTSDYMWYRDSIGVVHEFAGPPHRYYTNWVTFYKR